MSKMSTGTSSQYLTFKLDGELFAIEISSVREVLDYRDVTKIPEMPRYVRGVINLRGEVVPVADLRLRFGMPETARTVDTCIVIVEVKMGEHRVQIGALADSVAEVLSLDSSEIVPPPRMGARIDSRLVRGMGRREDELVIILDLDKAFCEADLVPEGLDLDLPDVAEAEAA